MQALFGTIAVDAGVWLRIILVASSVFLLVELEKLIVRRAHAIPKETD